MEREPEQTGNLHDEGAAEEGQERTKSIPRGSEPQPRKGVPRRQERREGGREVSQRDLLPLLLQADGLLASLASPNTPPTPLHFPYTYRYTPYHHRHYQPGAFHQHPMYHTSPAHQGPEGLAAKGPGAEGPGAQGVVEANHRVYRVL